MLLCRRRSAGECGTWVGEVRHLRKSKPGIGELGICLRDKSRMGGLGRQTSWTSGRIVD